MEALVLILPPNQELDMGTRSESDKSDSSKISLSSTAATFISIALVLGSMIFTMGMQWNANGNAVEKVKVKLEQEIKDRQRDSSSKVTDIQDLKNRIDTVGKDVSDIRKYLMGCEGKSPLICK